jgi:putative transposase
MACELRVRISGWISCTGPERHLGAILVLPRLAYLTLCRSIQLLVLLAGGDAVKDLESLVLRHQLSVLRRETPQPKLAPPTRPCWPWSAACCPDPTVVLPRHTADAGRRMVAGAWTFRRRGQGRPPLDDDGHQLIVRLAQENPRWGYQRDGQMR